MVRVYVRSGFLRRFGGVNTWNKVVRVLWLQVELRRSIFNKRQFVSSTLNNTVSEESIDCQDFNFASSNPKEQAQLIQELAGLVSEQKVGLAFKLCSQYTTFQLPEYHLKLLVGLSLAQRGSPELVKLWFSHCRIATHTSNSSSYPFASTITKEVVTEIVPFDFEWLSITDINFPVWLDAQVIILFSYSRSLNDKTMLLPLSQRIKDVEVQALKLGWKKVAKTILDTTIFLSWGQLLALTHCYKATAIALGDTEYLWEALTWLKKLLSLGVDISHPQVFVCLMDGFEKVDSQLFSPETEIKEVFQLIRSVPLTACKQILELMQQIGCRFFKAKQLVPFFNACFPTNLPATDNLLEFNFPSFSRHYDYFPSREHIALIEAKMLQDQIVYDQATSIRMLSLLSIVPTLKSDFIRRWNSIHRTLHIPSTQGCYYLIFISQQRSSEDARKAISIFLPILTRELKQTSPVDPKLISAIFGALKISRDPSCFVNCFRFARDHIGLKNIDIKVLASLVECVDPKSHYDSQCELLAAINYFITLYPSSKHYYQLCLDFYSNTHQSNQVMKLATQFVNNFYPAIPLKLQLSDYNMLDIIPHEGVEVPSDVVHVISTCVKTLLNENRVGLAGRLLRQYGLATFHPPSLNFFDHANSKSFSYFPTRVALNVTERALAHHNFYHGDSSQGIDLGNMTFIKAVDLGPGHDGLILANWIQSDFLRNTVDIRRFYQFLSCFRCLNPSYSLKN